MAQTVRGGNRAAVWIVAAAVAASVAASCSSQPSGPAESTASQADALTFCGAPFSLSVTIRESTASQAFATQTLNPAAGVVVPLELSLSGTTGITSGRVVQGVLSFNTPTGAASCTYSATAGASPPIRLAFVSCSNGAQVGAQVGNSQTQLSGNVSGSSFASGTLSISNLATTVDDGTPCTTDVCSGSAPGTISHSNAPAGTSCDDALVCNGINTCNGSGACVAGTAPAKDDGDPCTTDAPSACTEPYGYTHTKISGCGAPSSVPAYAGGGQVPSDFATGTSFIYTGGTQTGLQNSILSTRAAVIRGRIVDRDSQSPVSGATVTVLATGYGQTLSRSDGFYDLVVNGGDTFTLQVAKTGYPTVQRKVETRWLDFSVVPDISMVPLDAATPVAVNSAGTTDAVNWTVATASSVTDGDGTRQARVLIPPSTTIGGWTPQATNLNFRVTEYTLGTGTQAAAARAAMPGELPFNSAYTYAVELSIDEVPSPTFTNSNGNAVMFYVDNFTGPGLSTLGQTSVSVPAGYYDRAAGMWKPEPSGNIVRILTTNGNTIATLSLDGTNPISGSQQTDLGVTTGELQTLASAYPGAVNKDLWRVRMTHFSPWDCNWNGAIDPAATPPPKMAARADTPKSCPLKKKGSVIECEDQVLGESIPIGGTPFSLNYRSEAQAGYQPSLIIPISDDTAGAIPASFDHGEVEITVAGRRVFNTFAKPGPNERLKWTWDRTDAYGRLVQGTTIAHVRVSYAYKGQSSGGDGGVSAGAANKYTTNFGSFGSGSYSINQQARVTFLDNVYDVPIGGLDSRQLGLGGWTLSPVHVYEPQSKIVWYGDGTKRLPSPLGDTIETVFDGSVPGLTGHRSILATADGSVFVARATQSSPTASQYVGKLTGSTVTPVSGTPGSPTFLDGAALSSVSLVPTSLALGPDGRIYVADRGRIVSFDPQSLAVYHVAGLADGSISVGNAPRTADGQAALNAAIGPIPTLTFGSDGLLYFLEGTPVGNTGGSLIRRIRANGTFETVAGNGADGGVNSACATTTCLALQQSIAQISIGPPQPFGLAADAQGRILFASNYRVWRVEGDGALRAIAGNGSSGSSLDGGPATSANIGSLRSIRVNRGALYLSDVNSYVRKVSADGVITTVAGTGTSGTYLNNVPATTSSVYTLYDVAFSPDGKIYTASEDRIRRFGPATDASTGGSPLVISEDGSEVYQFDSTGRHTGTRSAYRGTELYHFDYWAPGSGGGRDGKIWKITDTTAVANGISADHNVTTIDYPTATSATITSPYGIVTTLDLSTGFATTVSTTVPGAWGVTNPTRSWVLGYSNGLLTSFRDPKNQQHTFAYTATGLLANDVNPFATPYGTSLARSESNTVDAVQVTSPEFRISNHVVDLARTTSDAQRYERRTHTDPANVVTLDDRRKDGTEKLTLPQLSGQTNTVEQTVSADPRFGFGTPYASKVDTKAGANGSLKTNAVTVSSSANLTNSVDPFSLVTSGTALSTTTSYSASSGTLGTVTETFDRGLSQRKTTLAGRDTIETLDATDRTMAVSYSGTVPNTTTSTSPATEAYTYDGAGRLTQESMTGTLPGVGATTRSVTYGFDSTKGWLSSIAATGLGQVTYSNWDATGRPQHVVLPGNRAVDLVYDFNGNVSQVTTPLQYVHGLTPNAQDLLSLYTPPSVSPPGGNTQYAYDRDGLVAALTEPVDTVTYERDGAGRLVRRKYWATTGFQTLTTSYDSAGHVASINSNLTPAVSLSYVYDGDMVTKESYLNAFKVGSTEHNHSVDKTFDGFQRVATQRIDSADATGFGFNYDTAGLLGTVTAGSYTYSLVRTSGGNPSAHALVASATVGTLNETYEYDAFSQLVHYKAWLPSMTVFEITYERQPATGRVSAKVETINGIHTSCRTDYVYEPTNTNFLSQATRNGNCFGGAGTTSWTYDADGNVLGGGNWYDAQDRLKGDWSWTYGYDGDGNITALSNSYFFTYDAPGNLRRMQQNGGYSYDYRIDGRDRRIAKVTTSGGTLQKGWLYDGARIVAEVGADGELSSHFAYATKSNVPDLMWHKDGSTWNLYRILSDQLGSVVAMVNVSTGAMDAEKNTWTDGGVAYYAWPSKQPFGFAGGLWDGETGNYRFGARDYNPWKQRWWSKDPSRFAGGGGLLCVRQQ